MSQQRIELFASLFSESKIQILKNGVMFPPRTDRDKTRVSTNEASFAMLWEAVRGRLVKIANF